MKLKEVYPALQGINSSLGYYDGFEDTLSSIYSVSYRRDFVNRLVEILKFCTFLMFSASRFSLGEPRQS